MRDRNLELQARIQGRWNGWIFTPLYLSPLLSFLFSYPWNIEIIFDFPDIITKIHPPISKSWIRPWAYMYNLIFTWGPSRIFKCFKNKRTTGTRFLKQNKPNKQTNHQLIERISMKFTANGKNETFAVCLHLSVQWNQNIYICCE